MKKTFTNDEGMSLTTETLSSISIDKNSKGYSWSLKLYFNESDPQAADNSIQELKRLDTKLQQTFGGSNG